MLDVYKLFMRVCELIVLHVIVEWDRENTQKSNQLDRIRK